MLLTGRLVTDPEHQPQLGWLTVRDGRIAELGFGKPRQTMDLGDDGCLICPGFIDAHLHLPQVQAAGCDRLDLMHWLDTVIYPAEAEWADPDVAGAQIRLAYQHMLRAGTLGYAGYLTSHPHGPSCLLDATIPPLRAHVGPSLMDRNAPDALLQPDPTPPHASPRLPTPHIAPHRQAPLRLTWTANPRFAVSCSERLLAAAGRLAGPDAFIQTHLAESRAECDLVAGLFPDDEHYTAVYDRHDLLTERTLLAHCTHLTEPEWRLIAQRRCVVVHCPTANVFLRSGLFNLDAARRFGVRIALGSDLAAGPDIAMPRVARAMIETAKVRAMTVAPDAYIPPAAEAWRLITEGNADALGWPDAGRLSPGASADLLILKPPLPFDEHLISRLIHTWRDDYIVHRIVAGRPVELDDPDRPAP